MKLCDMAAVDGADVWVWDLRKVLHASVFSEKPMYWPLWPLLCFSPLPPHAGRHVELELKV